MTSDALATLLLTISTTFTEMQVPAKEKSAHVFLLTLCGTAAAGDKQLYTSSAMRIGPLEAFAPILLAPSRAHRPLLLFRHACSSCKSHSDLTANPRGIRRSLCALHSTSHAWRCSTDRR